MVKSKSSEDGSSSTPKFPYTTKPKSLREFLKMVPDKPRPPKVIGTTLKTWGFKDSNDSTITRVLKGINLLSPSGETTEDYARFMRKDIGPSVLGELIKNAYSELFLAYTNPESCSNEELTNFFNINSGGGEQTIKYQVQTFKALADNASFEAIEEIGQRTSEVLPKNKTGAPSRPSISIDLHIHLPNDKSKSDYDAIIESIADHLYGGKSL